MVAGGQTNWNRRNQLHRVTTMNNLTTYDHKQPEDHKQPKDHNQPYKDDESDMTQLMITITNVPTMVQRNTQKHKLLQTQVPTFKGQKERYNEFEHFLLNHIRLCQEKSQKRGNSNSSQASSEKKQLNSGKQPEWLQTPHLERSYRFPSKNMPGMISARYHDIDGIFSKMTLNTNLYLSSSNTSRRQQNHRLIQKTLEYVIPFLFGKLSVTTQNDTSVAGKQDATVDETKAFFQRRYQYQQLMGTQQPQFFNEHSSGRDRRKKHRPTRNNTNKQRKFSGTCCHSNHKGYKVSDCRKTKPEIPQSYPPHTKSLEQRQQPAEAQSTREKTRFNCKLICQIYGNTGHSALTYRHRNTNTNAYRKVPYQHQNLDENWGFRKDFKQAHKRQFP